MCGFPGLNNPLQKQQIREIFFRALPGLHFVSPGNQRLHRRPASGTGGVGGKLQQFQLLFGIAYFQIPDKNHVFAKN